MDSTKDSSNKSSSKPKSQVQVKVSQFHPSRQSAQPEEEENRRRSHRTIPSPLLYYQQSEAHPSKQNSIDAESIELEEMWPPGSSSRIQGSVKLGELRANSHGGISQPLAKISNLHGISNSESLNPEGINIMNASLFASEKKSLTQQHEASSSGSSLNSLEETSQFLKEAIKKKTWFAYWWCVVFFNLYLQYDCMNLYFTKEHSPPAKILMFLGVFMTAFLGLTIFAYKTGRVKIWIPLGTLQFRIFFATINLSFSEDFYYNEDANYFRILARSTSLTSGLHTVLFFQNNLMILELIRSRKWRRIFVIVMFLQVTILFIDTMIFIKFDEYEDERVAIIILVGFGLLAYLILNTIFTYCIYNLHTLSARILNLEVHENQKYKYMFNALQDAILLVKDKQVTFKNKLGASLLSEEEESGSQEARSKHGSNEQEKEALAPYEKPIFYLFQDFESAAKPGERPLRTQKQLIMLKKEKLSLSQLLELSVETVNNAVFTDSQAVAESTQMDQVQRIVEEGGARFFSVKLIRVDGKKKNRQHRISARDEVMVQVQDISLRVQSQHLKVERQYMSLMNSTVSHEMRNPLNAIIDQADRQRQTIDALDAFFEAKALPPDDKAELDLHLERFRASLRVSQSSTNLIRFNVEDILALPQLKAGKFTKNIQDCDLAQGVLETIEIMEAQASAKAITVTPVFQGFPDSADGRIALAMDLQRFQQVLLNYLSNALKFTEKHGRVTALFQYVGEEPADAEPRDHWQRAVDNFYGGDFLADSDSDTSEDLDVDQSSSSYTSEYSAGSEVVRLMSGEAKARFRAGQRDALGAMFENGPKVVLSILDSGVGVKVVDQAKLFRLFGCLSSTRKVNTKGIGLGLSISKMISEEFGGEVAVHSKKGRGSVFQASFKLLPRSATRLQKTQEQSALEDLLSKVREEQLSAARVNWQRQMENEPMPGDNKKILILDDEAYNIEVLSSMLISWGIPPKQLVTTLSSRDAYYMIGESIQSDTRTGESYSFFGLVLTDLSMPIMDGYRFSNKSRKLMRGRGLVRSQQPRMVALTGHTESEFFMQAFHKGLDEVYSKPINSDQIGLVLLEAGFRIRPKEDFITQYLRNNFVERGPSDSSDS